MATATDQRTFTYDQVSGALNRAVDDIQDATDLPETGAVDAMNLAVNATMVYLTNPDATLDDVAGNYDCGDLNTILNWIDDGDRDEDDDEEDDEDRIDEATIARIYGRT